MERQTDTHTHVHKYTDPHTYAPNTDPHTYARIIQYIQCTTHILIYVTGISWY